MKIGNIMKTAKLFFTIFASLIILAACGGGGESLSRVDSTTTGGSGSSGGTTSTPAFTIAVSIVDTEGVVQTQLAEGSPLYVNVVVKNESGNPVKGEVVSYVLSETNLAIFNNDTGTALTNDDGIASIQMTVGSRSGSGTVTASIENAAAVVIGFESAGTQQAIPASLALYANAVQLASSGEDKIELIAAVKNQQNILLPGVSVSFSVNNDASLSEVDLLTNDDGTARAVLSTQNNKENRSITVTATSASLSQTLVIDVVGTAVNINGASSVIINDSAPVTIVLSDSDGIGIPSKVVNLTTTLGSVDNTAPVTGENGQVTVNFTANQAGSSVITASALNASSTFTLAVQQDDFSFNSLPTESLPLNEPQNLNLRWFKNNTAFANGSVTVTASRGSISVNGNPNVNTVTTDINGIATVAITSAFAGPASISAVGTDEDGNQVTARASVEFVASTVFSVFVDATPDLMGPEGQTASITAVLRDDTGNLIKGKTVNFRLTTDASGGSISPNTAITDSNGIASTVYTSNAVSGNNGVTITAESDNQVGSTDLSVGERAFDISLGTGSAIEVPDNSSYMKEFAVFVTDASGRPVANASLTASVTPRLMDSYRKGEWFWVEDDSIYAAIVTTTCHSEDSNQNGRLDDSEKTSANSNGDDLLTPGNVSTVSFRENISRTDDFGQATIQVRYPKQFGFWSTVVIKVFGQSAGSESMQSQEYTLGVASSDLTNQASPPPSSPFGQSASCNDAE